MRCPCRLPLPSPSTRTTKNKALLFVVTLLLFTTAACSRNALFSQAEESVRRGRYQQAIETFRTFYIDNSEARQAPEALMRIGNIYRLNLKEYRKSVEAYKALVNRFPESKQARDVQLLLGRIFAEQLQDYDQAVVEYQRVVMGKGYNNLERAFAKLESGNAYYTLGNFQQARIEYEGVKQLAPDSIFEKRAVLQLAHTYDAESDFEQALTLYREVAAFKGDDGKSDVATVTPTPDNKDADAVRSLKKTAPFSPLQELIQQGRFGEASSLEELGRYDEALVKFNELLETYPSRKVVEIRIDKLSQRVREVHKP